MKARLVVVGGEAKTQEVDLRLPTVIGRGREASLTLPHPLVSRRHCEIYEEDGQLLVRDLGSLNGTFVGSERITEAELAHGALLTIGAVTFRAVLGSVDEDQKPPAAGGDETVSERHTATVRETLPRVEPVDSADSNSAEIAILGADAGSGSADSDAAIQDTPNEIEMSEQGTVDENDQAPQQPQLPQPVGTDKVAEDQLAPDGQAPDGQAPDGQAPDFAVHDDDDTGPAPEAKPVASDDAKSSVSEDEDDDLQAFLKGLN